MNAKKPTFSLRYAAPLMAGLFMAFWFGCDQQPLIEDDESDLQSMVDDYSYVIGRSGLDYGPIIEYEYEPKPRMQKEMSPVKRLSIYAPCEITLNPGPREKSQTRYLRIDAEEPPDDVVIGEASVRYRLLTPSGKVLRKAVCATPDLQPVIDYIFVRLRHNNPGATSGSASKRADSGSCTYDESANICVMDEILVEEEEYDWGDQEEEWPSGSGWDEEPELYMPDGGGGAGCISCEDDPSEGEELLVKVGTRVTPKTGEPRSSWGTKVEIATVVDGGNVSSIAHDYRTVVNGTDLESGSDRSTPTLLGRSEWETTLSNAVYNTTCVLYEAFATHKLWRTMFSTTPFSKGSYGNSTLSPVGGGTCGPSIEES